MRRAITLIILVMVYMSHYLFGDNKSAIWVMLYYAATNAALGVLALSLFSDSRLFVKVVSRSTFTYFASAFTFYIYAFIFNKLIYFSESGFAGVILTFLLIISVVLTLIDHYARH